MGSGSLPAKDIATKVLSLDPKQFSAEKLSKKLRKADSPIITRISHDKIVLDFRTVFEDETSVIAKTLNLIFDL